MTRVTFPYQIDFKTASHSRTHTHIFKQGIVVCTGVASASLTAALLSKPCSYFSNCSEQRSTSLHALQVQFMAGLDSGCD